MSGNSRVGFTQSERLLDAKLYQQVFAKAAKSSDPFFTVLFIDNGNQQARLGLAIAKKNTRQAVQRNRLKRLIRESFRHNKTRLSGADIVVLASYRASRQKNAELFDSLNRHWKKVTDIIQPQTH